MNKQYNNKNKKNSTRIREEFYYKKILKVNFISAHGNRRNKYNVLMIVGDCNGKLGYGLGSSLNIRSAIFLASNKAKKNIEDFSSIIDKTKTLNNLIRFKYKNIKLLLKPNNNFGIKSGLIVRSVAEAIGIKNITSKIFTGSGNSIVVLEAIIRALKLLRKLAI